MIICFIKHPECISTLFTSIAVFFPKKIVVFEYTLEYLRGFGLE